MLVDNARTELERIVLEESERSRISSLDEASLCALLKVSRAWGTTVRDFHSSQPPSVVLGRDSPLTYHRTNGTKNPTQVGCR